MMTTLGFEICKCGIRNSQEILKVEREFDGKQLE